MRKVIMACVNSMLLAATVRSFAHLPLGISDRNSSLRDLITFAGRVVFGNSASFPGSFEAESSRLFLIIVR